MGKEATYNCALEMANHLHKEGTSMGLAIYKSARYYGVDQHTLAVLVGKNSVKFNKHSSQKSEYQTYWWDNG